MIEHQQILSNSLGHPTDRFSEYLFGRPIIAYDLIFGLKSDEKQEISLAQTFVTWGKQWLLFSEREKCRFGYEKRPATIFEKAPAARKLIRLKYFVP